jgi:hypothetical protein
MSPLYLSASTPRGLPRRLHQLTSLSLAGLLASLLAGCSSSNGPELTSLRNDTDWQTTSSYASANAALGPTNSIRAPHIGSCVSAPCELRVSANRPSLRPGL